MAQCFSLHIGGNSGPSGDKVSVNGTLAVNDTIYVGDQNNGTLEIDGGSCAGLERATGQHRRRHYIYGKPVAKRRHLEDLPGCTRRRHARKLDHGRLLHLVGGTVQAIGTLNFAVPATIGAGGATIDSNGFACTVSGVLSGDGGLTKIGTGTLTLTASNTYFRRHEN